MDFSSKQFIDFKNNYIEERVNSIFPKDVQIIFSDKIRAYKMAVDEGIEICKKWNSKLKQ